MTGHGVLSISKKERVITVKCQCGDSFDSIESEALARLYLSRHIRHMEKKAQS